MAVTSTNKRDSTELTARITVRIPVRADGDLKSEVERQLLQVPSVTDISVDGLRNLEPRLSATSVTVTVTVRAVDDVSTAELRDALRAEPCVERVESATHTE